MILCHINPCPRDLLARIMSHTRVDPDTAFPQWAIEKRPGRRKD